MKKAAASDAAQRRGYSPFSLFDDSGKMDVQLNANVEDQDRAECGKNDAGGMKSSGRRRKQVRNGAADDPSDDAEHDCPENRHVYVHHRFRDNTRDQPNKNIPD
jgi:hypothetical protein